MLDRLTFQVQRHLDSTPQSVVPPTSLEAHLPDEEENSTIGGALSETGEKVLDKGEEEREAMQEGEDPEEEQNRGVPLDVIPEEGTPRGTPDLSRVGGTCGEGGGEDHRMMEEEEEEGVRHEGEMDRGDDKTVGTRVMEGNIHEEEEEGEMKAAVSSGAENVTVCVEERVPGHTEGMDVDIVVTPAAERDTEEVFAVDEVMEQQANLVTSPHERELGDGEPPEVVGGPEPPGVVGGPEPPGVVGGPEPPEVVGGPEPPGVVSSPEPPGVVGGQSTAQQLAAPPGTEHIITTPPHEAAALLCASALEPSVTTIPISQVLDHCPEGELRDASQSPQSSLTSDHTPEPQQAVQDPGQALGLLQKYAEGAIERRRSEGDAFVSSLLDQRSPSPSPSQQFKAVSSGVESPQLKRELSPTPSNDSESSSDSKPPLPPPPFKVGDKV